MVDKRVTSLTTALENLVQLQLRSRAALEKNLGWTAGTISRLFSGRTKLTLRHLVLLLRELGVAPDEFSDMTFRTTTRLGRRPKKRSPLYGSSLWDPLDL
jgi:transcriptional regulator with XRE-family HTH domain